MRGISGSPAIDNFFFRLWTCLATINLLFFGFALYHLSPSAALSILTLSFIVFVIVVVMAGVE